MHDQVGAQRLLESRRERVHERVRELADEADGVRDQVGAPADLEGTRGRIERVEEPVAHAHVGARERVQESRLAGVRVARQRDGRQAGALALGTHRRARRLRVLQAATQGRDAVARQPAVGLDLRLARAPGADTAVHAAGAEALEVRPEPAHAREVVLQLRKLDLELALGRVRVVGEDVEDDRRPVDDRDAERFLDVALLARQQLVVTGDQVRVRVLDGAFQLLELAAPEVTVGVGLLAPLDELAHSRDAGRAEQLAQLREVRLGRADPDAQRALSRPGSRRGQVLHSINVTGQLERCGNARPDPSQGSCRRSTGGITPRVSNSAGIELPGSTTTASSASPSQDACPTA